jgi:hypothetical protein
MIKGRTRIKFRGRLPHPGSKIHKDVVPSQTGPSSSAHRRPLAFEKSLISINAR